MRAALGKHHPASGRKPVKRATARQTNGNKGNTRSPAIRVFVVEDHPMTARALKTFLGLRRCAVEVASTFNSAVALAPKIEFDVLVCDLNLPDGSGWELPAKLGDRARFRAIAYSALDAPHQLLQSRQAGFAEHVVKGCDPDELLAAIERVFHRKGRLAE